MKRIILSLILAAALFLSACGSRTIEEYRSDYAPLTGLDHCVVEPDVRERMTDADRSAYRGLMDAVLAHRASFTLPESSADADLILDQLRRSPYGYFLESHTLDGDTITFRYAYSAAEQMQMLRLIDSAFLEIVNFQAAPEDNELDTILKIYSAVTRRIDYDKSRKDNKQLGSPLFDYPADEIYKALSEGRALCYGFAYVMRFALLQRGIDCFCVYGQCIGRDSGHEWVVFRWDNAYFHCDPAWDRSGERFPKLLHFGKTDAERSADNLAPRDFADYHTAAYANLTCDDERFSIFRGIVRFTYLSGHRFYCEDRSEKSHIFNTETFRME